MKQNRREFITTVAAAGAAIPFVNAAGPSEGEQQIQKYPLRLFSKPIDSYDFGFMCECLVRSGIKGFDMTVRKGGKVEPSKVETDLPKLVGESKKHGLAFDMMVTEILEASDPFTERVLKTASANGIKWYRFGWAPYDNNTGILECLGKYRQEMIKLAELNKKYKIHGGYQNHAGARIGGPVWDLHELLKDLPADYAGNQYDVRHAMVEGANSWIIGMKLLAPRIRTLAIKDFTWQTVKGKPQAVTVPMGEGMVNWDLFFKTVKELNITGPLTLHVEYPLLENGQDKLPLSQQQDIIVAKFKKDVDFINTYLVKYQLV